MDKDFLKNITILYVEDEDEVRELTFSFLDTLAKNVVLAKDGEEGLDFFKKHFEDESLDKIDIIITDINMPKMNGLEMLKNIGNIDRFVPSLVTTAHDDPSFLKKAMNQRVRGYVSKPLNMHDLVDSIINVSEPKYLKDKLVALNKKLKTEVDKKTHTLKSILNAQDNLILVLNEDSSFEVNQTLLDFFAYKDVEEFTQNHNCISELFVQKKNYYKIKGLEHWADEIMQCEDKDRVVIMANKDNEEIIFRVNVKSFIFDTQYRVVSFTDITDLKNYTYELQYKATHDNLTGLYNRQKLNDELEKEITRENRYKHGLSLLMFDIDNFKSINDTYGHDIGDIVLKDISKIAKNSIRMTDCAARWGGEEFMILFPETSLEDSYIIAEVIRKNIEKYTNRKIPHSITISIGIAEFSINNDDIESWIRNVDVAMYKAKKTGKNKVVKHEK